MAVGTVTIFPCAAFCLLAGTIALGWRYVLRVFTVQKVGVFAGSFLMKDAYLVDMDK